VTLKRNLDKQIYLAAPFFHHSFFDSCIVFQKKCFDTYAGWGKQPLLKTAFARRKEACGAKWETSWEALFSKEISNPEDIKSAYEIIMTNFSREMGIVDYPFVPHTGKIPKNY
jgi:hypothetical protein